MYSKKIVLALCPVLACMVGCGEQTSIENAVRAILKDSNSAEFKDFTISANKKIACVAVNAKNSFGGYGDWQYIELRNESNWVISKAPQEPQLCSSEFFKLRDEFFKLNDELLSMHLVPEDLRAEARKAQFIENFDPELLKVQIEALRDFIQTSKELEEHLKNK